MSTRQIVLPISTEEIVAEHDSVRVIEEIIDKIQLPVSTFNNKKQKVSDKNMVKIIIYGYMEQITSLRNLEKACKRDINFKWLLQGNSETAPSKSSIGRFIHENEKLFDSIFNEVVKQMTLIVEVCGQDDGLIMHGWDETAGLMVC